LSDLRAAELSVFSEEEEELDISFDSKENKNYNNNNNNNNKNNNNRLTNAKSNSNLLSKSVISEKCSNSSSSSSNGVLTQDKCGGSISCLSPARTESTSSSVTSPPPEVTSSSVTSSSVTSSSSTKDRSSDVSTPESSSSSTDRAESSSTSSVHEDLKQDGAAASSVLLHDEMAQLYEQITNQKEIVMHCLESESCDVSAMEEQVSTLQSLQNKYIRMEFDHARNLWMKSGGSSNQSDNGDNGEYESTFSRLVEQEVDKRLFQEKLLRAESEYQERELIRIEKERELSQIKREHDREIYLLRRKLHEASMKQQQQLSTPPPQLPQLTQQQQQLPVESSLPFDANVTIPSFKMTGGEGAGGESYIEYVIWVRTGGDGQTWCIHRRFRQFRVLHVAMCQSYGSMVTTISFPARRLFGNKSSVVAQERKQMLQRYLNTLIQSCSEVTRCPLYKNPTKAALVKFAAFFEPCSEDKITTTDGNDQSQVI